MTNPSQLINKFPPFPAMKHKVSHTITSASRLQAGQAGEGDSNNLKCNNLNQQNSMNNFMSGLNESFMNMTDTLVNVCNSKTTKTENVVV